MEFSIFSLLIYLAASQYKIKNSFLIAVLTASFFAILIEVLQLFVPLRTSNFFDALSGILGSFLILFFKIKKRRKKWKSMK